MSALHLRNIAIRLRGIKQLCNQIRGGVGTCPDCDKNEKFVYELLRAMSAVRA